MLVNSVGPQLSLCVQGEQCNVVPDTIDDIVADIGQEEKEEGTVHALPHHPFLITVLHGKNPTKIKTDPHRWITGSVKLVKSCINQTAAYYTTQSTDSEHQPTLALLFKSPSYLTYKQCKHTFCPAPKLAE